MSKILLLEDDILFADTLVDFLEESGFTVSHCANGQSALDITFAKKFDLYLLDIAVPLVDGLTFLKELRESGDNTAAIFLTSHKDREILKRSYEGGGDDFITKPFDANELIFRINAVLKRANGTTNKFANRLYHDEIHKRILYNNAEIELSKKEYDLLLLLMKHSGKTVPKELISDELWSSSQNGSDGAVRVYINRIKQILPEINIENIRGIGYKLVS